MWWCCTGTGSRRTALSPQLLLRRRRGPPAPAGSPSPDGAVGPRGCHSREEPAAPPRAAEHLRDYVSGEGGRRGRLTPQGAMWRPRPWTPVGADLCRKGFLGGCTSGRAGVHRECQCCWCAVFLCVFVCTNKVNSWGRAVYWGTGGCINLEPGLLSYSCVPFATIYLATRCRTRAPASQTTTIGSVLYL